MDPYNNTFPQKGTLIHFNDIVKKESRGGLRETEIVIEKLLDKLDLFRIGLSDAGASIHDLLPLVHSMKTEKKAPRILLLS